MLAFSNQLKLGRCPHCNAENPELPEVSRKPRENAEDGVLRIDRIFKCTKCGGLIWSAEPIEMGSRSSVIPLDRMQES